MPSSHGECRCFLNYFFLDLPRKEQKSAPISTACCGLHTPAIPPSAAACAPPQSSAASVEDVGWSEAGSRLSWWERAPADIALRLTPETPHPVAVKAQQQLSRGRLARSSSLALMPVVCMLSKENSSKGLRVMESCCYRTRG